MDTAKDRSKLLEERLISFALDVISLTKSLPQTFENKIIFHQIIRSATSMGANYTEANNAASRQDFRSKIFICKKETAETRYWLVLLSRNNSMKLDENLAEVNQLLMIFQKIISTLKAKAAAQK